MNGRRAIVGLCMLCALLVSAFAAQGASAAPTTAQTCVKDESGPLFGSHCLASGSGDKYKHVEIAKDTTTELRGNNTKTTGGNEDTVLKATLAGSAFTLTGKTVSGSGWMTNATDGVGGEMYAHGEGTITYTEVSASGNCKVFTDSGAGKGEEGVIHTEPLKASTKGLGEEKALKFEPKEGTVFARFLLEGCTNAGINGTYTVTGSIKSTSISGATTNFTHENTTSQNTLKLNGTVKAGINGFLTLEGKAAADPTWKPLSVT